MPDFWNPLSSSSAGSVQETSASSGEQNVEGNPVTPLVELQQSHCEVPSSPFSAVRELEIGLTPIKEDTEESTRSIERMEREGVFQDVDGDGIPDYNDVTGTESRFSQAANKGMTGAMDAVRAMMSGILGLNFSPIKSVELESEIGKIQGANLQTTMAATHKHRITTQFDVGVPMRSETAQMRRNLFRLANVLKGLNRIRNFYGNFPKVGDRSQIGNDMPRPR
jgi:hypothetical protein